MVDQTIHTLDERKVHFAALAIGATAREMGVSATEVHNRLKRYGLIQSLLFDCYDTLHTESINGVVWSVMEALKNREQSVTKQ